MQRTDLPLTAFIDPDGNNHAAIFDLLHAAIESAIFTASSAADRSPLPRFTLPDSWLEVPDAGRPDRDVIDDMNTMLRGSMNAATPRYLGHMDSMPATMSLAGDLGAAAVNNNMLSVEMSPVFSRLEAGLLREIGMLFGYGPTTGGVMASGGSVANMLALAVARNRMLNVAEGGMSWLAEHPVILASEAAHTSIQKTAMLLGIGTSGVITIETDVEGNMDANDLLAQINAAQVRGQRPFAIVATAGTTVTGSIDPIPAIADIAQQHDLWLHVDAAYGGALIFSENYRNLLIGISRADSITFNPQKWLYVAKTSAMTLFRDVSLLNEHFRVGAPYMREDTDILNRGEIGVQGTRHADVLKLWMVLQHLGSRGIGQLVDASFELMAHYVSWVKDLPYLRLLHTPQMNLIVFRGQPDWIAVESWDAWNADLQTFLLHEYGFFLSLPRYRGMLCLRAVLLNPFTEAETIDELFKAVEAFAARTRP